MRALNKRLGALETVKGLVAKLPAVWVRPGQTDNEARAAAGLPPDAPNMLLRWRVK